MTSNTGKTAARYEQIMSLFLSREVRQLLDHLSAALHVRAVLYDAYGNQLIRGGCQENCRCCTLLQQRPNGLDRCLALDRAKQKLVRQSGKMIVYRCHANLVEALSPVKVGDDCAGFVVIGQIRPAGVPAPEDFSAEEKAAFEAMQEISESELEARVGLFQNLVNYIASREFIILPGIRKYDRLVNYIDRHLTEKLSLPEAARHVGMSVSGLTRYLRSNFDTTFKSILINKRLDRAAEILRNQPEMSLAEVASQVGYDDEFYFSRLFSKKHGIPPGKFRNK